MMQRFRVDVRSSSFIDQPYEHSRWENFAINVGNFYEAVDMASHVIHEMEEFDLAVVSYNTEHFDADAIPLFVQTRME